jgi:hypothetical protein
MVENLNPIKLCGVNTNVPVLFATKMHHPHYAPPTHQE